LPSFPRLSTTELVKRGFQQRSWSSGAFNSGAGQAGLSTAELVIHFDLALSRKRRMDSRFRGNDGQKKRPFEEGPMQRITNN
jgi:hypothetical protein